jgi:hypothetical protein
MEWIEANPAPVPAPKYPAEDPESSMGIETGLAQTYKILRMIQD